MRPAEFKLDGQGLLVRQGAGLGARRRSARLSLHRHLHQARIITTADDLLAEAAVLREVTDAYVREAVTF